MYALAFVINIFMVFICQISGQLSVSDMSSSSRKCKHTFFDQINNLINAPLVEKELRIYYPKGLRLSDKPAYSPLLLFKMVLLEQWYGMSGYQVEEEVMDFYNKIF